MCEVDGTGVGSMIAGHILFLQVSKEINIIWYSENVY